ncbi:MULTISPECIES: helix-turn-helix transcriptional regulator [Chryseobacterium group]|uniref:helix-turn-helix transcriptional regulator n=1 Tax=Chryseobacterium group TaxID=2782232 RepID=UPI0021E5E010|nr:MULTISPECIES: AraC family transcriptional regulator [Chryseobacterium group]MDP9955016.1 AraC-like DNA-binding protein [Epilithonimonas hungarica]
MNLSENKKQMLDLAEKLGMPASDFSDNLDLLRLNEVHIVDMLPEMLLMIRSVVAKETFTYKRKPINAAKRGLLFSFQNISGHSSDNDEKQYQVKSLQVRPHVRISPLHLESEVVFPKGSTISQITILIELDFLRNFIGKDQDTFGYLFNEEKTLLIEEFMSPGMAYLVNEIAGIPETGILSEAYYKLKALELLYLLFKNLSKRQHVKYQSLRSDEIEAVYRVRDAVSSSLERPLTQEELVRVSGMNVLKLRKLFTQIFGKGIYEYGQYLRMQEAARLMREKHLSVSETGYQLGFTNLSYFGRLFEQHFGMKPKKWSAQHRLKGK